MILLCLGHRRRERSDFLRTGLSFVDERLSGLLIGSHLCLPLGQDRLGLADRDFPRAHRSRQFFVTAEKSYFILPAGQIAPSGIELCREFSHVRRRGRGSLLERLERRPHLRELGRQLFDGGLGLIPLGRQRCDLSVSRGDRG